MGRPAIKPPRARVLRGVVRVKALPAPSEHTPALVSSVGSNFPSGGTFEAGPLPFPSNNANFFPKGGSLVPFLVFVRDKEQQGPELPPPFFHPFDEREPWLRWERGPRVLGRWEVGTSDVDLSMQALKCTDMSAQRKVVR